MRALSRLLSVLLLAGGAGLLVYGLSADPAQFRAPFGFDGLIHTPAELMGYAVGMLVAGILLLLLFGARPVAFDKPGFDKSKAG